MTALNRICAGCSMPFQGADGVLWCPKCRSTVKSLTVELSALQRRQLEALAIIRGVSPAEVLRQGIAALAGKHKGQRLSPNERTELARLRTKTTRARAKKA